MKAKAGGRRWARSPAVLLLAVAATASACISGEDYRGTDGSALLPRVRAEWLIPRATAGAPPRADAVHYQPVLAAQGTALDGDFDEGGDRVAYRVWAGHVAFQPEIVWRSVQFAPFVGVGYQRVDLDVAGGSRWFDTFGPAIGAQIAYRGTAPFVPFARYETAGGGDVAIGRGEVGLELLLGTCAGLQVAYGRQRTAVEEFFLLAPLVGDSVRIVTEGVHLGFVLRF